MLSFTPSKLTRSPSPDIPLYLVPPNILKLLPLFDSPECLIWEGATKNNTPILKLHNRHISIHQILHDLLHVEKSHLKLRFHPCRHSKLCVHPDHVMVSLRSTTYNLAFHTSIIEQKPTADGTEQPLSGGSSPTPSKPLLPPSEALFEELLELCHDLPEALTSMVSVCTLQNEGRPPHAHDPLPEITSAMVEICNSRPHVRATLPATLLTELKDYLT